MKNHKALIKKAMKDPAEAYKTPESVLDDTELSDAEKLALLENWQNEVQQILNSEAENMHPDMAKASEAELLQQISQALEKLNERV